MKVKKFQQGGPAPEGPQPTNAPQAGGPEEQILAMAQEIVSQMGPEAAAMLAQAIVALLEQATPSEQPAYQRKGGRLIRLK